LNERFSDPDGTPSYNLFFEVFDRNDFQEYYDEILYLQKIGVKKSKFEENYRVDQPPYFIDFYKTYEMNPYRNSYVNIVTETGYISTDVIHITEKSLMLLQYHLKHSANRHFIFKIKSQALLELLEVLGQRPIQEKERLILC
jgi:hypothetical protein